MYTGSDICEPNDIDGMAYVFDYIKFYLRKMLYFIVISYKIEVITVA